MILHPIPSQLSLGRELEHPMENDALFIGDVDSYGYSYEVEETGAPRRQGPIARRIMARRAARALPPGQMAARVMPAPRPMSGPSALGSKPVAFLAIQNAEIQQSPLGGGAVFPYRDLAYFMRRTAAETPSQPYIETANAVAGAATVTVTQADIAAINPAFTQTRLFVPFFIIRIAAPQLFNIPAGIVRLTCTVNSENTGAITIGQIVISINRPTTKVALTVVPYRVVQSIPKPIMALIAAGGLDLAVQAIDGLPDNSRLTVVVPGSTHPSFRKAQALA